MESKIISLEGKIVKYKGDDTYCFPFIRKMLDLTKKASRNELAIAKKIMKNPLSNVVNVLKINEGINPFIDYQRLITGDSIKLKKEVFEKYNDDVREGLKNLHGINIVYLDLKWDNVGFDIQSNQWKIFDFDASGICSKNKLKWILKPPDFVVYNFVLDCEKELFKNPLIKITKKEKESLVKICKKKSLLKFDEAIFFLTFKTHLY